MYDIQHYQTSNGKVPFREWRNAIRDPNTAGRIDARLARLRHGILGDAKPLRGGIWELRLDFGPGYRIYFAREGSALLLLLAGGTKRGQSNDILKAKASYADYRQRKIRAERELPR